MASRHYFGWYASNVLDLDARDIALHFGHQDGGELVRKLYGHPDAALARDRVRERRSVSTARARPARRCGVRSLSRCRVDATGECQFDRRDDVHEHE